MKKFLSVLFIALVFSVVLPIFNGILAVTVYAATVSVTPSDDAYVNQGSPTLTTGAGDTIRVKQVTGAEMESFLKFKVTGIGTVERAVLKLYCTTYYNSGQTGNAYIYGVNVNTWLESTLSWNNKPTRGNLITQAGMSPTILNNWISFDVTSYVTGSGTYSFNLTSDYAQGVFFSSSEGANSPVLEITPPAASINISDDAYVNQSSPTLKTGAGDLIKIKHATGAEMESFLKFNVTGIDVVTVESATLKIYSTTYYGGQTGNAYIYGVSDNRWGEATLGWNNKPARGNLIAQAGISPSIMNNWVSFDVTSYVTGNGIYSFNLTSDYSEGVFFSSSEGVNPPVLEIRGIVQPLTGKAALGYADVTLFGADPVGVNDSTVSIQQAIDYAYDNNMAVFFPSGTYLVSDTLKSMQPANVDDDLRPGHVLIGSTVGSKPVIKLKDYAAGFQDASVSDSPTTLKAVVHFWRQNVNDINDYNPENESASLDFNQVFRGIDIDLGTGNPGAVGIRHRGAEGSAIQDVKITATGGFAGVYNLLGSGGSLTDVEVVGGRYGIYAPWAQPAPLITGLKLSGQTDYSILYKQWTPITIVGFNITKETGPITYTEQYGGHVGTGNMSFVDGTIEILSGGSYTTAVQNTDRTIYMKNVYIKGAGSIVSNTGDGSALSVSNPLIWNRVNEYSYNKNYTDPVKLINGIKTNNTLTDVVNGSEAPPADLISRHVWPGGAAFGSFENPGVVNVKDYGAKGDGVTDDTQAIRNAVAAGDKVFLPRGNYKVSGTITLGSNTQLFGVAKHLSILKPIGWMEALETPVVTTVNDTEATTAIADFKVELYYSDYHIQGVKWMAGRNSISKDVWVRLIADVNRPEQNQVLRRTLITGNGGGRWYNIFGEVSWDSGHPDSRQVMIEGRTQPLTIYMFQTQYHKSAMISEIKNAFNVTVYALKAETLLNPGSYTGVLPIVLGISNSANITVITQSGTAEESTGESIVQVTDSNNVTIANMARWNAPYYPANTWYYVKETYKGVTTGIDATGIVSLFKRN